MRGGLSSIPGAGADLTAAGMAHVWRVAPRRVYRAGALTLSAEAEVTSAVYASGAGTSLRPERAPGRRTVTNERTLLSPFYHFQPTPHAGRWTSAAPGRST